MKIRYIILAAMVSLWGCSVLNKGKTVKLTLAVNTANAYDASADQKAVMKTTLMVIKKRLEAYGVEHPSVELVGGSDNVYIEFTSRRDLTDITKYLLSRGKLEMTETFANEDFFSITGKINDTLSKVLAAQRPKKVKPVTTGKTDSNSLQTYVNADDGSDDFRAHNPLYAIMTPYIDQGNSLVPGPVIGYILARDTAQLRTYLSMDVIKNIIPARALLAYGHTKDRDSVLQVYALKLDNQGRGTIGNQHISGAQAAKNQLTEMPSVTLQMNQAGALKWAEMTRRNIEHYIAVVYDGHVVSCPRVMGEITGGATEISGAFTKDRASELAGILSSGALPAPVSVVKTEAGK